MKVLKFVAGLLLIPVFAVACLAALGFTSLLITNTIEAWGDWDSFVAQMRHYSDRIEVTPDGAILMHRARHPVATFFGMLAAACMTALLTGYALRRLFPRTTR